MIGEEDFRKIIFNKDSTIHNTLDILKHIPLFNSSK